MTSNSAVISTVFADASGAIHGSAKGTEDVSASPTRVSTNSVFLLLLWTILKRLHSSFNAGMFADSKHFLHFSISPR